MGKDAVSPLHIDEGTEIFLLDLSHSSLSQLRNWKTVGLKTFNLNCSITREWLTDQFSLWVPQHLIPK